MEPANFNIYEANECPLTLDPIKNKGILFPCGHVFELAAIQEVADSGHTTCPLDNKNFQHICTSNQQFIQLAQNEGGTVKIHKPDPADDSSDDSSDDELFDVAALPRPPAPAPGPAPARAPIGARRIAATPITAKEILIKRGLLAVILGVAALGAAVLLGILFTFPPAIFIGIGVCVISVVVFAILNAIAEKKRLHV